MARLLLTDLKVTKEDLESINKRFLLIVGKNDIISLSDTKAIAGSIPDSRLVVVPKEGHKLAQARPDLFNEYLIEFLKGKKMLNFIKKHRKGLRLVFMLAVFALVVFEFGVLSKEFSLTSLRSYMASYGLGFIFTILALSLGMAPPFYGRNYEDLLHIGKDCSHGLQVCREDLLLQGTPRLQG